MSTIDRRSDSADPSIKDILSLKSWKKDFRDYKRLKRESPPAYYAIQPILTGCFFGMVILSALWLFYIALAISTMISRM